MRWICPILFVAVLGGCAGGPPDYGDWSKWYSHPPEAAAQVPTGAVTVIAVPVGTTHRERVAKASADATFLGESQFYTDDEVEPDDETMQAFAKSIGANTVGLSVVLASQHDSRGQFFTGWTNHQVKTWGIDATFWRVADR